MNNPTSTNPTNTTSEQNAAAPKTEQKNPASQPNQAPATGGADRKDDKNNNAGKEARDAKKA